MAILGDRRDGTVLPAGPADFDTEWLSLVLGIKVVDGLDEAIQHIADHSTGHSDGILTGDDGNASRFRGRGRLSRGLRECQHSLHGWGPAGAGDRGGDLNPKAAGPRADGPA